MSNTEVLEEAIRIAIKNGWTWPWSQDYFKPGLTIIYEDNPSAYNHGQYEDYDVISWPEIIYDHQFAQALWGSKETYVHNYLRRSGTGRNASVLKDWQYHLQQMVISDDPLRYLADNMPEKA